MRGKLTLLPALQVIARASSVQYTGSKLTPAQIAQELGVQYLLTGTVRWAKGSDGTTHVLVRPELVQLGTDGTGSSRWQQPFDAPLTDVFRLQADIANRVTEALSVALPAAALKPGGDAPTQVPAAYDAYLRARAAWNGGTNFSLPAVRRARVLYQQAVSLDSNFASAWGGVAMTSIVLYANSVPTPVLASDARTAVDRMQALDPDGVETWTVRARYLSLVELEPTRALAELDSALARSPNDAMLLGAVAAAERSLGRWDDALRHSEAAYAPRSPQCVPCLSHSAGIPLDPPAGGGPRTRRSRARPRSGKPRLCPAPRHGRARRGRPGCRAPGARLVHRGEPRRARRVHGQHLGPGMGPR